MAGWWKQQLKVYECRLVPLLKPTRWYVMSLLLSAGSPAFSKLVIWDTAYMAQHFAGLQDMSLMQKVLCAKLVKLAAGQFVCTNLNCSLT